MRFLIVATNKEKSPFPVAPIGALMVAGAAREAGHDVALVDMNFAGSPKRAAARAVRQFRPDVIGFSVRNLDNCFMTAPVSYVDEICATINAFRAVSNAPTIAGGPAVSIAPESFLEATGVDHVVVGEGERAIVELLDAIDRGAAPDMVVRAAFDDMSALPPTPHDLLDYSPYLRRGGFVSLQTKRGCPHECSYCVYPTLEGARCRPRPVEAVVDEIARLKRDHGHRHYFFTDSVFNTPAGPARALLEAIERAELDIEWTAYCNPRGLDDDFVGLMKRTGCLGVELGLDAVTENMIANLSKNFTPSDIERAFSAIHAAGLPFATFLLFGGPEETEADILASRDFLDGCAPSNAVFACFGIRLLANTPLAVRAAQEGVIDADDPLFMPRFYVSDRLGPNFAPRLDAICRTREEWSSPTDWQRPLVRGIQWLAGRLGVRPGWKDIRQYGRRMRRRLTDSDSDST